jgi:hypothetical protein
MWRGRTVLSVTVLLSGTMSLPSMAAQEVADGLVFEAVRPGIERVVEDGAGHPGEWVQHVAVAPDGRVWAATAAGTIFAVGGSESFGREAHGLSFTGDLLVLDDGTVVAYGGRRIASWDGTSWSNLGYTPDEAGGSIRPGPAPGHGSQAIVPAGDGGYWALLEPGPDGTGSLLARLGPTRNEFLTADDLGLELGGPTWPTSLARTPDGSVWVSFVPDGSRATPGLARFDGESWSLVDPVGDGGTVRMWDLQVGADGVLSALADGREQPLLARWDGDTWTMSPAPAGAEAVTSVPDRSEWPDPGWLRWAPSGGAIDYAFPGPFSGAHVEDLATAADGTVWAALQSHGEPLSPDAQGAGLYRIDPQAAAASLPAFRTMGRQGLVPLLHPAFAAAGGGDGGKRANWTQRQGTDIVAEIYAVGDQWFAGLDSVGPAGDRWIRNNSAGTGPSPKAALRDALRKEPRVTFVDDAVQSAMLEWPPKSKKKDR